MKKIYVPAIEAARRLTLLAIAGGSQHFALDCISGLTVVRRMTR